jgi:hypothetical protein
MKGDTSQQFTAKIAVQTAGAAMSFSGWGIWKFDH